MKSSSGRKMDHGDVDPALELVDKIGYIDDIDLFFNKSLVALYVRPEKTKSGIILADSTRDEDLFQGKAGLVLKKGPTAFMDDGDAKFHGQDVNVGDWIVFRPSNGLKMDINGVRCVLLQDVQVELRIPSPDVVF
jgi:co-chaperonin GroES (HSP10)